MVDKVMNLLQKALSPSLTDVSVEYDKNLIESVTPNP